MDVLDISVKVAFQTAAICGIVLFLSQIAVATKMLAGICLNLCGFASAD